jgi:hypothetical protein
VLFWWDMETIWWQRLILNNLKFAQEVLMWFDFYIASHHWHKSWYHPNLLNKERIKTVFISKASEVSIDWTDVFPYSEIASWYTIESIKTWNKWTVKMASTRNHWNIFINLKMWTIHSHKWI